MEGKSNKFLKVTGILMIIGGSISIILGIIAVLAVSVVAALGADPGLLTFSAILFLLGGVVSFVAGIVGVKNAAKPEKAMSCIVLGILTAVISCFGNIIGVVAGNNFDFVGLVTGLVLPALYLIGAFQNKKLAS